MIQLKRPSLLLLLIPLHSLSSTTTIAAPAQQEQLDQSRAQEAERQERLGEKRVEVVVSPPHLLIFPQMRAFDSTSLISRLRTNKYIILNVSKQITLYCYRRCFVHRGYQNDTRGIALARDTVIWRSSIVQPPFWFFCTKLRLLHVCFVQQPLSYHKISTA